MSRRGLVLVMLAGCSQILGLSPPHEGLRDAPGRDASQDDAAQGDFTARTTTIAPRVPQNSFDFLDVAVTRSGGFSGAITVDIPAPPAGVTVTPVTIDAGSLTGRLKLTGAAGLTVGSELSLDVHATGGAAEHAFTVQALVTLQPGTLDPGYGPDGTGVVKLLFAAEPAAHGFFTDGLSGPAGSVIAVGCAELTSGVRGMIERLTPTGELDTAFGSGGLTLATPDPASTAFVQLLAATRPSSGGTVAAGEGHDPGGPASTVAWATAFQPNGLQDDEFGNDLDDSRPEVRAIVALADNTLITVEGTSGSDDSIVVKREAFGSIDPTFNAGAPVALGFEYGKNQGVGGAGALATDVAGLTTYIAGGASTGGVVVHLTAGGAFDNAFGSGGVVEVSASAAAPATALVVQDDGNLVAGVGSAGVVRLTSTGALDPAFGTGGAADLGANTFFAINAMAIQSDGKIVVAGGNGSGSVLVLRLLPDGTLDTSYGNGGAALVGNFSLSRIIVAADGGTIGVGLDTAGEPLAPGAFRLAP